MYAILIGASEESVYAIKKAQSKGIKVLAFDGNKEAEGLKHADESYVVDIRDPQNIIEILDEKGISSKDMFVLPVPIGRYLITAGFVNDHYGLKGPSRKTTELCTDKWVFHETLSKNSLRNIYCQLVDANSVPDKPAEFPVIVKPRYGAGSRAVVCVENDNQWQDVVADFPCDEDFIVEDAVEGTEYGVDGMVIDGKFHTILVRKKLNTKPPYRQCVGYISITEANDAELIRKVQLFMEKLVDAVEIKTGLVHADLIISDNNPFVIEMSARPSGHNLHNLFTPLVTGIDMVSDYIDYVTGNEVNIPAPSVSETYLIRYFDIESEIKKIPDKDYIVKKYELLDYKCHMTVGEIKTIKDGHSLMERGYFILKGDTEESVCERADELLREYT